MNNVGYTCKNCGEPAPIGVGYISNNPTTAKISNAITECACGYSQLSIVATEILEGRLGFLPHYLGGNASYFERLAFSFADLFGEYNGGFWRFYALDNGGFYIAPNEISSVSKNSHKGQMSADALGIVVTLFALNTLANKNYDDAVQDLYFKVLDFVGQHPEATYIYSAID